MTAYVTNAAVLAGSRMIRSVTTGRRPACWMRSAESHVGGIHGPGVQYAAPRTGTVVQTHRGSIDVNADGGEQPMGHAEHR